MKSHLFTGLISATLVTACASYPRPDENLSNSVAVTRGASEAGAADVPEARLQLKLAEEQIETARALMEEEEYEKADYMTLRAYYDAEVALALAREEAAKRREEYTMRVAAARRSKLSTAQNQE
jgi:predicted lipid-binding transport protein (Tim44 family)